MHHRSHRSLCMCVLGLLQLVGVSTEAYAQYPELELHESDRWRIATERPVLGADLLLNGMVAVWTPPPTDLFLRHPASGEAQISLEDLAPVLAVGESGSRLEVLTATPPAIHFLTLEGTRLGSKSLSSERYLLGGKRTRAGWWLLLSDSAHRLSRGSIELLHADSDLREERASALESTDVPSLVAVADDVILTERGGSREVRIWKGPSGTLSTRPPAELFDSLAAATGTSVAGWRTVSTLILDRGLVQTVADVSSDWRVLILYDDQGAPMRNPIYRMPFGLFASDPLRREAYALLRTNAQEVVKYEWRWRRPR